MNQSLSPWVRGVAKKSKMQRQMMRIRKPRLESLELRAMLASDCADVSFPGIANSPLQEYRSTLYGADSTGFHGSSYAHAEGEGGDDSVRRVAQRVQVVPEGSWQNPVYRMDVNGDGIVSAGDVLVQVNWINQRGGGRLREDHADPRPEQPYLDSNGDGWITPMDVLGIINWLNSDAPQAGNDAYVLIRNASEMTLRVSDNDLVPWNASGPLVITSVSSTRAGGSVWLNDDLELLYSSPAGFVGEDVFTYRIRSQGSNTDVAVVTVRVIEANRPPVVETELEPTLTVLEDADPVELNLQELFSDPDEIAYGDRLTYTIENSAPDLLNASLQGTRLSLHPREDRSGSVELVLIATDLAGATARQTLTISLVSVNDRPVGADRSVSLERGQTYEFGLSDFPLEDPRDFPSHDLQSVRFVSVPPVGSLTLEDEPVVAGAVVSREQIASGQLRYASDIEQEASDVTFHFLVQDDGGTENGGMDDDAIARTFTIRVTTPNRAPTDILLAPVAVDENVVIGTVVGTIGVLDPDANDTVTYALVEGEGDADNGAFTIADGELRTATSLDFETQDFFQIRIRATDAGGLQVERMFRISVADVNEAPTQLTLTSSGVAENVALGTVVGTFHAADPDANDTVTFTLVEGEGDADNGAFTIVDGELRVAASLDFETQNAYHIRVRATDAAGLQVDRTFTISVADVNEAPTQLALTSSAVAENVALGTVVGTFHAADPDANDTVTFTLVEGEGDADNGAFTIVDGALRTAVSLDFETQNAYHIRVRATDAAGLQVDRTFTISVADVNEAPTQLTLTSSAVAENVALGTVVGTFHAADPDANDTVTFTLVEGEGDADNNAFTIVDGELRVAASLDFETQNAYHIRVRATDAAGLQVERMFTIGVTNVNEGPLNVVPGNQATGVNQSLRFSLATGNSIRVTDPDSGDASLRITLTARNGTVSVDSIFGNLEEVNRILDELVFTPDADFAGSAWLEIESDDLGQAGSGGPLTDWDEILIEVN